MKTLRLFTVILLTTLVISLWGPAPVSAKSSEVISPEDTSLVIDLAKTKLAKLRVTNKTGGTIYISFSGPRSYSFSTSKQGKTTFDPIIEPGKYTVTVTASACGGSLTYKRNVKGGSVNLPPLVCKGKKKK
jgi:hypothetical protein